MNRPSSPARLFSAWPVFTAPRRLVAFLVGCELIALAWVCALAAAERPDRHQITLVLLLSALALAFEEVVARGARLQLRLSANLKRDMTSVWAIAAAVALSQLASVALLGVIFVYVWFRQQRPAGEQLFRKVFNLAIVLISCLAAGEAATSLHTWAHGAPWAMAGALEVCAAIVIYTVANRLLAMGALLLLGVRGKSLLGTRDENLVEIATLCLGGLVALAAITQPLLAILALAPMVTLQRGAVMRVLETAATTDAKTGLLNAVAWEEVATRELHRAAREGKPVAVLIIDIDHFKLVNDVHGHLVGDQVLRRLARTLGAGVREFDTVARFGGEEFVAVLPGAALEEAMGIAERLRAIAYELTISSVVSAVEPALDQRLAVSIGVAIAPVDGVEVADLLHMADAALYRAKAGGRNRVVAAGDGPDHAVQVLPLG